MVMGFSPFRQGRAPRFRHEKLEQFGQTKVAGRTRCVVSVFFRSPPLTLYSDIVFWHAIWKYLWHLIVWIHIYIHSDILSDILSGIYSDILSDISWYLFWHSSWHLFWHSIWHLSDILSGIFSGIHSGIVSGIYFDILSDMGTRLRSGSAHWHLELAAGEQEKKEEGEGGG